MFVGFGSGGRIFTRFERHPALLGGGGLELGANLGPALDHAADDVVRPQCGMSCTTRATSTDGIAFSTPSVNSSKNTIFMVASLWSEFQECAQRV